MTLASVNPCSIGSVVIGQVSISDGRNRKELTAPQPFYILREATFDEWVADCISTIGTPPPGHLEKARKKYKYFYEVSTD